MISILLATYNDEKYIKVAIESVLNQTFKDFELLIGFNGTTDSSKLIVSKFNDSRIRIYDYMDDKGKSKTLNKLLNEVNGEWCAIQDGDDIWKCDKLENQILHIENFDVIGTQIEYINTERHVIGGPILSLDDSDIKDKSFNGINQVANSSAIFRTSIALEMNGWSEDVEGIEDYDFWLRIMRRGYKFININYIGVGHRLHDESNFNTNIYDIKSILNKK